jgi:peroxin-19
MATQDEQEKLNAALDAALDELDDDDDDEIFQDTISSPDDNDPLAPFSQNQSTSRSPLISEPSPPKIKATTPSSAFIGPPRPPSSQQSDMTPEKFLEDMMKELSNVDSDAGMGDLMGRFLQEMQAQIKSEIDQLETGNASASSPVKSSNGNSASRQNMSATTTASPGKEEVDAVISNLVDDMTKKATIDQKELKRQSMATVSEDEMLNSIMEGFAHLGSGDDVAEDFDADAVIDGMMEHLLSKDLMYEPIKQVATRFPSWLEEKRGVLSHKEYAE